MNTHIQEGTVEAICLDGRNDCCRNSYGCSGIGTAMEANGLAQQPVIWVQ